MPSKSAGIAIRCKKCGSVIQSQHRHDMVFCECKAVAVDGGSSYLRFMGNLEDAERLDGSPVFKKESPDGE